MVNFYNKNKHSLEGEHPFQKGAMACLNLITIMLIPQSSTNSGLPEGICEQSDCAMQKKEGPREQIVRSNKISENYANTNYHNECALSTIHYVEIFFLFCSSSLILTS